MNCTHKVFALLHFYSKAVVSLTLKLKAAGVETMPHVIVKLWPGKSEQQKEKLAERITKDVMEVLHYGDESVSVTFEISAEDWAERVYRPDVVNAPGKLYKKPGYRM